MPDDAPRDRAPEHRPSRRGLYFLLAAFAFVLLLVLLFARWGSASGDAVEAEIAKYHAAGQPILLDDFVADPLSDEQNGALDLRVAFKAFTPTPEQKQAFDARSLEQETHPRHAPHLAALLVAQKPVLDRIRLARSKPGVDWGIRLTTPVYFVLLPNLNGAKQAANFLSLAAVEAHAAGDDAAALEYVHDLLYLSRAVDRQPFIVGHLVSNAVSGVACDVLERITHDLRVEGTPSLGEAAKPASREQVASLLHALADEKPLADGFRHALYGERAAQLDTARAIAAGKLDLMNFGGVAGGKGTAPNISISGPLTKPFMYRDALQMMRLTTRVSEIIDAPDWPTAKSRFPTKEFQQIQSSVTQVLAKMLLPSLEAVVERHYRALLTRRVAALRLSFRLYQLDHAGRLPTSLADLVPAYLPALSIDPFFAGGQRPLAYLPDARILYSVGEDGLDQSGDTTSTRRFSNTPPSVWDMKDYVFPLTPPPLLPPDDADDAP